MTTGASANASGRALSASAGGYQYGTAAQVQALVNSIFGPGKRLSQFPQIAQQALRIYAKPVTAKETAIIARCLKTTAACSLGHSKGTINVAESEDTNNAFFEQARVENLLMAIREPSVKTFSYTNANFVVPQALSNFQAHISQGANVIIGSFDLANVMLPVIQQAAAKHITVWAANQSVPSAKFDGADLAGDVLNNLCAYGKQLADKALPSGKSIAMYTGLAGSAFAAGWQKCATAEIAAKGGTIVENGLTGWTPQGEEQAAAALVANGTLPDSLIYDYTPLAFIQKFLALGKTPPTMVVGGNTMAGYAAWKSATTQGHPFKIYSATSEEIYDPVALHAAIVKHLGGSVPAHIVLPQFLLPMQEYAGAFRASLPGGAEFNSGLPNSLISLAFQGATS